MDPRLLFGRALDQSERLVACTRPEHLADPTPCTDFDVRALLGHTVAVLRRIAHVGRGGDPSDIPHVITDVDDWAATFRKDRADVDAVWTDDALLDTELTLPWGTMPGRVALTAWAQEFTVHAWDLAQATGRTAELDPGLGEIALDIAQRVVPAEPRGGPVPFGPVVSVGPDADTYTRLAAHLGRPV